MKEKKAIQLIAEIGNCHYGSFKEAKNMIRIAKESGATLAKFQAFEPKDVAPFGSMPEAFYERCAFNYNQYLELIEIGNLHKIPVFFSTFSESMKKLWGHTFFHKVSAKQSPGFNFNEYSDKISTFVSVNEDYGPLPDLNLARVMYASKYLDDNPDLWRIEALAAHYKRPVGYSDHSRGIETCYSAVKDFGAMWIEKHFTLEKNYSFGGVTFRDSIHSATPKEFEKLAKLIL